MEKIIDDPNLVAKLAAQMNAEQPIAKDIVTVKPQSTEVDLPAGYINNLGTLVTSAEIRELNGSDEEAISAAKDSGSALMTILARGVVRLGEEKATPDMLDSLLIGDRDTLLLSIYRLTFSNLALYETNCLSCGVHIVESVDLANDVEIRKLNDPIADRAFEIETRGGVAVVSLPNGITQKRLLASSSVTSAESLTIILAGCIMSINGAPSMGASTALNLGIADRNSVLTEIYNRTPGPRLGEVTKDCKACGAEHLAPLSLAALFRV